MAEDYYAILGISRSASHQEVVSAYRKIAIKTHPDKGGSDEELFIRATEAYVILRDEETRKEYDRRYQQVQRAFTGRTLHGSNVKVVLKLKMTEVLRGITRFIATTREGLCPQCSGTGSEKHKTNTCHACNGSGLDLASLVFKNTRACKVCRGSRVRPVKPLCRLCKGLGLQIETIRREVRITPLSSRVITIPGSGNHILGGKPGDLMIDIQIDPDPVYRVDGLDLYRFMNISPAQAIIGDEVSIDVFGKQVQVSIPSGTQMGDSLTVAKEGVSFNGQTGNLYVKLNIDIPISITTEEKKLYDQILNFERTERRIQNA